MVERHVVFETIKIGEEIRKGPPPFAYPSYNSFFGTGDIRPIADVLPFHIVGGHITTSLDIYMFDILLAKMEPEGIIPPPLRLKFSLSQGSVLSNETHFLKLNPSMTGTDFQGKQTITLDKITHMYLLCKGGGGPGTDAIVSNDFLSMTLILEKEN